MRPIYESSADKSAEALVVKKLTERRQNAQFIKLPELSVVDYMVVDNGKAKALIEIKNRRNPADKYPTYIISERKLQDGLALSKLLNVPFVLVVSWLQEVRWVKIKQLYPAAIGGRYDRGDAQDIERVCHIPISDFKRL